MARRGRLATATALGRGRRPRGRGALVGRALAALALLPIASRLPTYLQLIVQLIADDRVPVGRKILLGAAAGYAILPADLIADRIPVLGALDDLVVGALAVELFLTGVPGKVLDEKLAGLGIPRSEFDEDRARIRRTVPPPLRRAVARLPAIAAAAGRAASAFEIGPRLRGWITKEDSLA